MSSLFDLLSELKASREKHNTNQAKMLNEFEYYIRKKTVSMSQLKQMFRFLSDFRSKKKEKN